MFSGKIKPLVSFVFDESHQMESKILVEKDLDDRNLSQGSSIKARIKISKANNITYNQREVETFN